MGKHPEELDIHDWQTMNEGETTRVYCSHWKCQGKKAAFTITRTLDGCVYNCYRCGTSGGIYRGSSPNVALRKLKELRDGRKSQHRSSNVLVQLPFDFVPCFTHNRSIPPQAFAWIYQYELTDMDMYTYNIGFSSRFQRVIIPIYDTIKMDSGAIGYKLIAWQGRDVFYKRNKELFKVGVLKKDPIKYYTEYNNTIYNNIYSNNKLYYKIISKSKSKDKIIIVEDILSTIKVYNHYKVDTIALLNSTITNKLVSQFKEYKHVYIWLDWDARVKAIKASRYCQSQGINTTTIRTTKDPKAVPYIRMPVL